jgi:hypothetical protein
MQILGWDTKPSETGFSVMSRKIIFELKVNITVIKRYVGIFTADNFLTLN